MKYDGLIMGLNCIGNKQISCVDCDCYNKFGYRQCWQNVATDAKETIESLYLETESQSREIEVLAKQAYNIGKSLVLTEFVAKLKACATIPNLSLHGDEVVYVEDIDRILKEMMEDGR